VIAGRYDLEIIALDRFGILPEPGALYQQDPDFVDELLVFLEADADHTKQINDKLNK
jgi:hypothetical protein